MRLIDADALYERACSLEAQSADYAGKLIKRDGDKVSVEWKIWSAVLTERIAFKHDVLDAPTIEPVRMKGKWIPIQRGFFSKEVTQVKCDQCGNLLDLIGVNCGRGDANFCPNCGADMRGEQDG